MGSGSSAPVLIPVKVDIVKKERRKEEIKIEGKEKAKEPLLALVVELPSELGQPPQPSQEAPLPANLTS